MGAKHVIWDQNIKSTMNQFKTYFVVIQQNETLMQYVQIEINKLRKK
jgi:hypothetical protein